MSVVYKSWITLRDNGYFERDHPKRLENPIGYFLDHLDRIFDSTYKPTRRDVMHLHLQVTTTEFDRISFNGKAIQIAGNVITDKFKDRRANTEFLEGADVIFYVVPLGDYDLMDPNIDGLWAIEKSLHGFKEISSTHENLPIFLFFNKYDLWLNKIEKKDLSHLFKSYDSFAHNEENALKFMIEKYTSLNINPKTPIYVYITMALDADHVKETNARCFQHCDRWRSPSLDRSISKISIPVRTLATIGKTNNQGHPAWKDIR
jgi:hypothetical protein